MGRKGSDTEIHAILDGWMAAVAPPRAPERLLEESFARTMVSTQSRLWPWHRVRGSERAGNGSRRIGMAAFAAALVLTVAVVASIVVRPSHTVGGPTPVPIPSVSPSVGASASASADATPLPSALLIGPTATIPVTGAVALATDGSSVWLFTSAGKLMRIDPVTNTVATTATLDPATDAYQTVAGDRNGVWVADWDSGSVLRFDPRTLKSVASIHVGSAPKGVLVTTAAVWVADTHAGSVLRLDPKTNQIVATIPGGRAGLAGPNWLARGSGSIWTGVPNIGAVVRINERTNAVEATITVPAPASPCGGLAAGSTAIWITSCDGGPQVTQIDPATNRVVGTIDLGGNGYTFALVGDRPWVSPLDGQIVRLDPVSHAIDRVVAPGTGFVGGGDLVVAAGAMWVIDYAANRVLRVPIAAFGG
jgi:YVTN family beta-propeller protein